jgi:general secretion pathway protein A
MYERFFQLTKMPFPLVSDPECIHLTAQHESVIRGLVFAVLERRGYLVLTGEAGLGKTTALRALAALLIESEVQASVILTPTLTASEFLELLMLNFGFNEIPASKARRLRLLESFLIHSDAAGQVSALIVDEAHQLSEELLEEIRLLGNFEASGHRLLQIVLAGQTELNDRLNLPQMWHLKQRIATRLSLRRLDCKAVEEYMRFRWNEAGGASFFPFTDVAVDAVAAWSCGIPRLINSICDNALVIAFSETTRTVDLEMIREACVELMLPLPRVAPRPRSVEPDPTTSQLGQTVRERVDRLQPETPAVVRSEPKPSFMTRWLRRRGVESHRVTGSKKSILALNEPLR